jgi:hypothetical protein
MVELVGSRAIYWLTDNSMYDAEIASLKRGHVRIGSKGKSGVGAYPFLLAVVVGGMLYGLLLTNLLLDAPKVGFAA